METLSDASAVTPANFRAARLRNCIAALDLMTAKTQQLLAELEPDAKLEQERPKPERSSILQLYVSRVDDTVERRCENLRATLHAIERERVNAEIELGVALRATEA